MRNVSFERKTRTGCAHWSAAVGSRLSTFCTQVHFLEVFSGLIDKNTHGYTKLATFEHTSFLLLHAVCYA